MRRAREDKEEESRNVVNQIQPDQRMDKVIGWAGSANNEDAQILEKDGECGDVVERDIESFYDVCDLGRKFSGTAW